MFCSKCGKKICNGAKFCTDCGEMVKAINTDDGFIEVIRDKSFACSLVGFPLYIDGEKVGTLSLGNSIKVKTTLGSHTVLVKIYGTFSKKEVILNKITNSVSMEITPVMGLLNTKPVIKNIKYEQKNT